MSTEANKTLVRHLIEEALNKGNLNVADESFAADYVTHIPNSPPMPPGPGTFKRVIGMWRSAFPDFHMTIEELIAEGDKVVNRFTSRGTHTGPLMGIPPTGKRFTVNGIEIHRIANGKVAETWICDDVPSILVQLGVLPRVGQGQGPPPGQRPGMGPPPVDPQPKEINSMSQFYALTWRVKPGSEQVVEKLFRDSSRPEHDIRGPDGSVIGRLLSTQVFMKDNMIVRVMEVEGDFREVAKHMGRQQEVRDLERELDKHLEVPRDMTTPEGAQKFFRETSMRCILSRKADQ